MSRSAATGAGAERDEGQVVVVHRMEGYFDKLKSKKNLGSDFNKRYFAVVRTPDKRFCLNYYGKRSDLADENCRPSGSIPLKEITYVGVPGQSVEDGGQPGFKVGDPDRLAKEKQKKKKKKKSDGDTILAHNPIMEEYAARGIQIGSLNQNIFIVATNKSMAQKWIAGLCFMRNLRLPPGTGWPKKFGPPPPCLFKADKNGKLEEAVPEEAKPLAGYFNSVVVEKDGTGSFSCKLKRRYFVVHDTNSPKRGSMELALCQYSKREAVKVGMQKCKGFLFLRHITKVERIDIQHADQNHPFLAGPPLANTMSSEAKKKFIRDQVYLQESNSVHGIQVFSPHMNLFMVAVSEEHLQYWIAGLNSVAGLTIPKGIAWSSKLHGPIPQAPGYLQKYRASVAHKKQQLEQKSIPAPLSPRREEKQEEEKSQEDFIEDDNRDNEDLDDDEAEAAYLRKQALLRGDLNRKSPKKKAASVASPQREAKDASDDDDDDNDQVVVKRSASAKRRGSQRASTSPVAGADSIDALSSTIGSAASNSSAASTRRQARRSRRHQIKDDSDSDADGDDDEKITRKPRSARRNKSRGAGQKGSPAKDRAGSDDEGVQTQDNNSRGRSRSRNRSRSRHRSRSRGKVVVGDDDDDEGEDEGAIMARKRGSMGSGFHRLRTAPGDEAEDGAAKGNLTPSKAKALEILRASMSRPAVGVGGQRKKRQEGFDDELEEGNDDEFHYNDGKERKDDDGPQESEADAVLRRLENRAANINNRTGPSVEQLEMQRKRNLAFAKARAKANDPQSALSMQRKIELAIEKRSGSRSGHSRGRSTSRGPVLNSDSEDEGLSSSSRRTPRKVIESRSQLAAPFGRERTRTPHKSSPGKSRFRDDDNDSDDSGSDWD